MVVPGELLLSHGMKVPGLSPGEHVQYFAIDHIFIRTEQSGGELFLHHGISPARNGVLNLVYSLVPDELIIWPESHVGELRHAEYTGT